MTLPTLRGPRLVLRPFVLSDAPAVQTLAGSPEVASTTVNIPHPYTLAMAEDWIDSRAARWAERTVLALAVTRSGDEALVGAVSLRLQMRHRSGELGYWIGPPYWNRGYATEASRTLLDYGFGTLNLNRVEAQYIPRNPSSGRVLSKLGMTHEGVRRQCVVKGEALEDLVVCSVLALEWNGA